MTAHYEDGPVQIWHGDCIDVMRQMPDASVDAVVTDPPYNLGFMGHKWDTYADENNRRTAKPAKFDHVGGNHNPINSADQARTRRAEGHKFQAWCEEWATEAYRLLKPGGHLLAFGGTRTFHRLTAGIEDAGFEIRDSIAWLYGSGFPKSLNVGKAIDKRPGVERHPEFAAELRAAIAANGYTNTFDVAEHVIGRRTGAVANWQKYQWPEAKWWPALRNLLDMDPKWDAVIAEAERIATGKHPAGLATGASGVGGLGDGKERRDAPATEDAARWNGWGTALKPAFEPIVVARKPLTGTVAANVLQWGTGALNIDASRIGTTENLNGGAYAEKGNRSESASLHAGSGMNVPGKTVGTEFVQPAGRWPANVVLDASQAAALDQQSGPAGSNSTAPGSTGDGMFGTRVGGATHDTRADGGASRFFKTVDTVAPRFMYTAKAGSDERPVHWTNSCECEDAWPTTSHGRATAARTTADASSTTRSGSGTTAQSPTATRSTTSTTTSSTTGSRTSSPSPRPTTNGSTADANSATASGGSPAASATSSRPSAPQTGTSAAKVGRSTAGAVPATSPEWFRTSVCGVCGAPAKSEAHATVKPVDLMRWLVKLVTPPGGVVLEPFAGSGTTVEACVLEGFHCIAIEREADYLPLILKRIRKPHAVGLDFGEWEA